MVLNIVEMENLSDNYGRAVEWMKSNKWNLRLTKVCFDFELGQIKLKYIYLFI